MKLSEVGRIAAALAAFSNSASKVVNLSMGLPNTKKEVKLRLLGSILVAGNDGLDNDGGVNDLFVYFTNLEFVVGYISWTISLRSLQWTKQVSLQAFLILAGQKLC
mmetsp:Transcript_15192/g.22376  ORF Transcript_15192/g.22376 Transcript_15192/m.22376 type:complete len:106 (-) Transcript_15192:486-803(-)